MKMKIKPAKTADVWHVAAHMRESDQKEFMALCASQNLGELAADLVRRFADRDDIFAAYYGDEPVAIGATIEARPNVLTLLFFGTNKVEFIGRDLTRFMKQRYFPPLKNAGVHRIECVSIDGHEEAHKWILALGLDREGAPLLGYGKNGETFHQFAWVKDELRTAGA
jgi:hypothetical protein